MNKDDELENLKKQLREKEKESSFVKDGLELSINDKDKLINKLKAKLGRKVKDISELSNKVSILEETILYRIHMYNKLSWIE